MTYSGSSFEMNTANSDRERTNNALSRFFEHCANLATDAQFEIELQIAKRAKPKRRALSDIARQLHWLRIQHCPVLKAKRQRQTTQRITVQRGRVWQVIDSAPLGRPIVLGDTQGRKWRVTRER